MIGSIWHRVIAGLLMRASSDTSPSEASIVFIICKQPLPEKVGVFVF
jgi:hypothetical protein